MPKCNQALIRASATVGFVAFLSTSALAEGNPLQNGPAWDDLKSMIKNGATAVENTAILTLVAPDHAMDPAFVPVHLTQPPGAPPILTLTVVIDENPAPMAAEISLGPAMMPLDLEIRMRVNAYSNIRAIATTDKASVLAGRYVKATGGCAAPASKDLEAMLAERGLSRAASTWERWLNLALFGQSKCLETVWVRYGLRMAVRTIGRALTTVGESWRDAAPTKVVGRLHTLRDQRCRAALQRQDAGLQMIGLHRVVGHEDQ